jgi:hypothetical protein
MKLRTRVSLLVAFAAAGVLIDALVTTQAEAVMGVRRRTAVRTAVVVGSAASAQTAAAEQEAAAANQRAAEAEQEAAAAQAQAAAAQPQPAPQPAQAPAPRPAGARPLGTIVRELPGGCVETDIGGVAYQKCGPDYYRAAFQGSQLVYVTSQP